MAPNMRQFKMISLWVVAVVALLGTGACHSEGRDQTVFDDSIDAPVHYYKYFSLFTLDGEPGDETSPVQVKRNDSTIEINVFHPEIYHVVLRKYPEYWYACGLFDLDKKKREIEYCHCPRDWHDAPHRSDLFVKDSMVYVYRQRYVDAELIEKDYYRFTLNKHIERQPWNDQYTRKLNNDRDSIWRLLQNFDWNPSLGAWDYDLSNDTLWCEDGSAIIETLIRGLPYDFTFEQNEHRIIYPQINPSSE
jgi:hypothetical protein